MSTNNSTATAVKVYVPAPLRSYTGEAAAVEVDGATVGEALRSLVTRHQALERHLYDEGGKLRSFVNIYKNEKDIRYLERESTSVAAGDTLTIVPSIAGGGDVVCHSSGHGNTDAAHRFRLRDFLRRSARC